MDEKSLYRTYVSALAIADDRERRQRLEELLAPDFVAHDLEAVLPPGNIASLSAFRARVLAAFPDQRAEFLDVIQEGDRVACRQRVVGTHRGPFQGVPPTGREVAIELFEWVRVAQGRIAERWVVFDRAALAAALNPPATS